MFVCHEGTKFPPPADEKKHLSRGGNFVTPCLLGKQKAEFLFLPKKMNSICVFCGSSTGFSPKYKTAATRLGQEMADQNIELIYGAGNVGLMGIIADAVLDNEGRVLGIIPGFLKEMEVCHTGLTELIVTQTMHERKQIMADRSDAVIVMPGGFGTLDEFFEILTWKQLHLHQMPIGILNVDGYFDLLLAQVTHMVKEGFVRQANLALFVVADEAGALMEKMKACKKAPVDKWL